HASLNRIFRLVWSAAQGCWVAVHEHARGRSKAGRSARRANALSAVGLASLLALGAGPGAALAQVAANATPQGGKLVAGQANWQQSGTSLTV
ncbi:ESPR domain-containing protein, partial [Pseudomonas aeruginosa]|uniref:ESPR domain-containing protein n=1 Tax=Pseudomonas aeruginosa TaxID=287 RepID=UPI002B400BEB